LNLLLENPFRKNKVSFLVIKTVKYKRGISCIYYHYGDIVHPCIVWITILAKGDYAALVYSAACYETAMLIKTW